MNQTRKKKAVFSWSSGKDSAYALYKVLQAGEFEIVALVTNIAEERGRVKMHDVREGILDAQLAMIGLPVVKVRIPKPSPNSLYEERTAEALTPFIEDGVTHMIFGDLFLEDIRAYREKQMAALDIECVFPLWGRNTKDLAHDMVVAGLEATIVCINPKVLAPDFAGRRFDRSLLRDLPEGVDPCGENGEFHTLVTAGPMMKGRLNITVGEAAERDNFVFTDVTLREAETANV
ncbi:MAG: adenine nucleotide alpha hydrolase [Alphaproteobacteria bacterium]|nr:adenine nucleotide alpha hydrolase [Alphaproteobacteria bacterium]